MYFPDPRKLVPLMILPLEKKKEGTRVEKLSIEEIDRRNLGIAGRFRTRRVDPSGSSGDDSLTARRRGCWQKARRSERFGAPRMFATRDGHGRLPVNLPRNFLNFAFSRNAELDRDNRDDFSSGSANTEPLRRYIWKRCRGRGRCR